MQLQQKALRILYWSATLLFAVPQAWSAVQYITEAPKMVETITGLGYPLYFMKGLAAAKLLGLAAILIGAFPVLKEWAYAGFTFEVLAAIVSHVVSGDALYIAAVPFAFLVVQLISYFSWRKLEVEPVLKRRSPRATRPSRPSGALASPMT
jgi:hypothetical protein